MGTAANVATVHGVATHIVMSVWRHYNTIVGSVGDASKLQNIRTTARSHMTMMRNPRKRKSEKEIRVKEQNIMTRNLWCRKSVEAMQVSNNERELTSRTLANVGGRALVVALIIR